MVGSRLMGSPPLLFSPSLASVRGGSVTDPVLALLPLTSSPLALLTRERRGKRRVLASSFLPPSLPFNSLVGIPQSQPKLDASGWRS